MRQTVMRRARTGRWRRRIRPLLLRLPSGLERGVDRAAVYLCRDQPSLPPDVGQTDVIVGLEPEVAYPGLRAVAIVLQPVAVRTHVFEAAAFHVHALDGLVHRIGLAVL